MMTTINGLLRQVTHLDGLIATCLVDPSTGTVMDAIDLTTDANSRIAGAAAADVIQVLSDMTARLAADHEVEDVIVTFSNQFHIMRTVRAEPTAPGLLMIVVLDRSRSNLAMAHRELRRIRAIEV